MAIVGIVLLVIGLLLAASEAHTPTHGISGSIGVAVAALGTALALLGAGAGVVIGVLGGVALAAGGGGLVGLTVTRSAAVRRRRVRGGAEGLIGAQGTVRAWSEQTGSVAVQGAVWRARRSPTLDPSPEPGESDEPGGGSELHPGDPIVVERVTGLTLSVRRAEEWELL